MGRDHRHGALAVTGEQLLERRIEDAYQLVIAARTHEGRQAAYAEMRYLCRQLTADTLLRIQRAAVTR